MDAGPRKKRADAAGKERADAAGKERQLTNREIEVLRLLAEGHTCKDIAVALGISVKTAETHRSNLRRKIHCHNAAGLALYAIRNRIIEA